MTLLPATDPPVVARFGPFIETSSMTLLKYRHLGSILDIAPFSREEAMRNNQPVTRQETVIPEGEFIYSRTDLRGIIEEANEAFAKISGFTREEMIGQPHNMVRHPDMPSEAFADLWSDLKAGMPWRGLVKNRRKDGGYYWVIANVAPVREKGQIVGYQSVRVRPTREEIAAAEEAYQRVRQGDKRLRIKNGRAVRVLPSIVHWFGSLPIQMSMVGVLALLSVLSNVLVGRVDSPLVNYLNYGINAVTGIYALIFLLWYLPNTLRGLNATAEHLQRMIASGDLKPRLFVDREDVVGHIARLADRFTSSVRATLQGMADSSRQVDEAKNEVHRGVQNVNRAAVVQSEATSAAAAAVRQVTTSIGEVAAHATSTEQVAQQAGDVARDGDELSMRASKTIHSLADTVKGSALQVEALGQQSEEISRIVAVIKEVADQTNLLALNAAIEAARAGEAGRGFAVVADEVRKLAERTGKATQEIAGMIGNIQQKTKQAVESMRNGAQEVEESVRLVQEASTALRGINQQMKTTVKMVGEITHSSNEQQVAMADLAKNVERVASMTEQNVSVVKETDVMVENLNNTVNRMRKAVAQYSV